MTINKKTKMRNKQNKKVVVVGLDGATWELFEAREFGKPRLFDKAKKEEGGHRMNGIFLSSGQNIKKGEKISQASLQDLAPTILYLFGLPVPVEMEGKVLQKILEKRVLTLKREDYNNKLGKKVARKQVRGKGREGESRCHDKEKVMQRLRDLGYM